MEKARYNARVCNTLLVNDTIEKDPRKILGLQEDFYRDLYKDPTNKQINLEIRVENKLNNEEKNDLDKPIEEIEIIEAIKGMNNGKTPGSDGIPVEFYKIFWIDLKDLLKEVIQTGLEEKFLHETARQGIINLIPKQGKDSRLLKNLRPITLLNVDYKIIEKILANRLKKVMNKLINPDQKGFMAERNISTNIRKICDIITYTQLYNIPAQVTSYDFQKAFDRVTHNCLFAALEMFNFGPNIIQWTKTLYTGFTAKVQNNGEFSKSINIERGIHQGGCCSSLYFLLCAELLATQLRHDKNIQGIKVNDVEYLLGLFADDTDNYMEHEEKSFQQALSVIQKFGQQSGLLLNYDKTTVYRIGSIHNTNAMFYTQPQLAWTNEPVNILGIHVCCDEKTMVEINYRPLISKVKQILLSWSNRSLSLLGKVLIINSLIVSQFVYKMAVLPCIPQIYLKRLKPLWLISCGTVKDRK